MDNLSRTSSSSPIAAQLISLIGNEGTAAHRYCASAVLGDRQSFLRDLVDFADFVHLVALLHGQAPGLIEFAATRTAEVSARGWLLKALDAFALEREYLGRLCVAVGPLPSTSGHHETSTTIAQQRHAIGMLAQSDRRGCALGAALAMVLEWEAIRAILDGGAIRLGMEPPPSRLPVRAEAIALMNDLPEPDRLMRAMLFGAQQLLGQHSGMWQLLEARAAVRRSS